MLHKMVALVFVLFIAVACSWTVSGVSTQDVTPPRPVASSPTIVHDTVTPTAASRITVPPAPPTATPSPASTMRIVVQLPDNSVQLVDASGNKTPLAKLDGQVYLASIMPMGDESGSALYVPVTGMTPGVLRVDASGVQKLDWIKGLLNGIAANSSQLAWGTTDIRATMIARVQISKLDGTDVKTGLEEIYSGEPKSLHVVRWSRDGGKLYFSKEPLGIGGYILFAGLTNLWSLDVSSGKATEVVHKIAPNAAVCIDDLSPDETQVADHCKVNGMEVINLTTEATRVITPPSDIPQFGVVGGARFSPDGSRFAYALARRDPSNEQGWVAVSEGTRGTSRLIATSPAQDYFWVAAWLDSDTIILQSGTWRMTEQRVWSVRADGSNLRQLADGIFLGMVGG